MNARGSVSWNAVLIAGAILVAGGMIALSLWPRGPEPPAPIAASLPPPLPPLQHPSETPVAEAREEEVREDEVAAPAPVVETKASNFVVSEAVRFASLPTSIRMLAFSADGRHLLAGSAITAGGGFSLSGPSKPGELALWEVPGGRLAWSKAAMHGDEPCDVSRVAFSPDGTEVWASFSYTFDSSMVSYKTRSPLYAWDWRRDEAVHPGRLPEATDESSGQVRNRRLHSLSPDGTSAIFERSWQQSSIVSSEEWGLDLLDATSLDPLASTPSIAKRGNGLVAIDPTGRTAAVTSAVISWDGDDVVLSDRVLIYDLLSGREQHALDLGGRSLRKLAFDGPQLLLVADDGAVLRWDVGADEPEELFVIENFYEYAMVAIDRDGRQMAVKNLEDGIAIWDLEAGLQTASITSAESPSPSSEVIAFSPSGDMLAIGGNDGGIFLWGRDLPAEAIGLAALAEVSPAPELVEPPPVDPTAWRTKWVGTWNEPYPLVGTRTIITLTEDGGGLAGTWSDPAPPNGTRFNFRIPERLSEIVQVDEWTLTCRRGKQTLTMRFVPGEYGAGPSMHVDTDGKGTVGALLGMTLKTSILKKE